MIVVFIVVIIVPIVTARVAHEHDQQHQEDNGHQSKERCANVVEGAAGFKEASKVTDDVDFLVDADRAHGDRNGLRSVVQCGHRPGIRGDHGGGRTTGSVDLNATGNIDFVVERIKGSNRDIEARKLIHRGRREVDLQASHRTLR